MCCVYMCYEIKYVYVYRALWFAREPQSTVGFCGVLHIDSSSGGAGAIVTI